MAMGEEAGSPAVLGEPDTPWGTVRGRGAGGGGGGGGGDGAPVTGAGPRPSFYSDIFTSLEREKVDVSMLLTITFTCKS